LSAKQTPNEASWATSEVIGRISIHVIAQKKWSRTIEFQPEKSTCMAAPLPSLTANEENPRAFVGNARSRDVLKGSSEFGHPASINFQMIFG
jgi:hypothetical protein